MPYLPTKTDAHTVLEHTSDGVLVLDSGSAILYANGQTERLFRQKAEALLGVPFWTVCADARTAEAAETLDRAFTRRLPGRFEIFHPGLYAWHAVTVAPSEGGAILFVRDVTDRMRMLRDEAVRHGIAEVISAIPVGISITRGPEHRFEMMNPFARELLGGRDVVGMTLQSAFPELVEQGFLDLLDGIYTSGEPYRAREMKVEFRRGSDTELTRGIFDVAYHPLRDLSAEITGILNVSVEVTELVEARRLAESQGPG